MILIGSRAAQYFLRGFRQPSDYDIICRRQEFNLWFRRNYDGISYSRATRQDKYLVRVGKDTIEFEIGDNSPSCRAILDTPPYDPEVDHRATYQLGSTRLRCTPASLDVLLALKKSHLHVPLKRWKQHIEDYHYFKQRGIQIGTQAQTIYNLRLQETNARHKSHVNLNMSNGAFFDKSAKIARVYVHDDVHRVVAYGTTPMFERIKVDGSKALCDKGLFQALSQTEKIQCVLEEAYVIALERKIIPALETNTPYDAEASLEWSLFRLGTTLTSGWFREFIHENYPSIYTARLAYDKKFLAARPSLIRTETT